MPERLIILKLRETSFRLFFGICINPGDKPAAGVVCGVPTSKLQFTLNNVGLSPVTFTENAEFRFIIPKGAGADKLVETSNAAGTMSPQSGKSEISDTVVFTWKPDTTTNQVKDNVTVDGTTGILSIVGKTISFTLGNDMTMANHTPKVSYNQTTRGAAQVATSINNGKLSITITVKRDDGTDTAISYRRKIVLDYPNLGAPGGSDFNPNPSDILVFLIPILSPVEKSKPSPFQELPQC